VAIVAGLDLSGVPRKCNGYAEIHVPRKNILDAKCLYEDREIIETIKNRISVVAIDAPISREPIMRELDREAIRRGYRVLPPSMRGMRILTQRAWRIYSELKESGVIVIETHPRSALKSSGSGGLEELLRKLGIGIPQGLVEAARAKDISDAIVASVVAYCYYTRECIRSIEASDGVLYLIARL
jgi:predicted nuclease with RNAse H fold